MVSGLHRDVASLVGAHIRTYEQLDVLTWLARRKGQLETLSSIADALALAPRAIAEILTDFTAQGLVRAHREGEGTSYDVAEAHEDVLQRLVEAHDTNLTGLISLLNAEAFERIRTTARRALVDAAAAGVGGKLTTRGRGQT
jgi:DNA-binding MarR family transcriptional regulator